MAPMSALDSGDAVCDGLLVGHVEDGGMGGMAIQTQRFNRVFDLFGRAAVDDDLGTMRSQAFGQRIADALARAGDQRPTSAQIEQWKSH